MKNGNLVILVEVVYNETEIFQRQAGNIELERDQYIDIQLAPDLRVAGSAGRPASVCY